MSFPLLKKSVVVMQPAQNLVYRWLTQARQKSWNE
jgi:glutathione peroxidase